MSGDESLQQPVGGFLGAAISGSHVGMWIPAVFWLEGSYLIAKNRPKEPPFDWKLNVSSIRGLTIDDEHCRLSINTRDRQGWEIRGMDYLWDRWSDLVDKVGQFHEIERIVMHGDGKTEDQVVEMGKRSSAGNYSQSRSRCSSRGSLNISPAHSSSQPSVSKHSTFHSSASVPMMDDKQPKQVPLSASTPQQINFNTLSQTIESAMVKSLSTIAAQGKENALQVAGSKQSMVWLASLGKAFGKYVPLLLKHELKEAKLQEILFTQGSLMLNEELANAGITSALHRKRICFEFERRKDC